MNINEENNDTGNKGGKSRFLERLKKILRVRRIKRRTDIEKVGKQEQKKKDIRVVFKPILMVSSLVVSSVNNKEKKQDNNINVSQYKNVSYNSDDNKKVLKENEIKETNLYNSERTEIIQETDVYNNVVGINYDVDKKIKTLQKDIISLIKKRLVKNINELEMLRSEFYILKEITGDDIYLIECTEKIKEIKKLLSKVKTLKEKYDYLKENIDFGSFLENENDVLVDKILELKELCSYDDMKLTVENYKILEEYKYLYLKIDKLEENLTEFNLYKKNQEIELKNRDIDFEKLKNDVYNKGLDEEKYKKFVIDQEMFLKNLNDKILTIDSKEVVNYRIKGFNQLLNNSFRYLGLLLASPLKGLFPSIVTQTVIAKNVVKNLYNSLSLEEEKKIVYETIDFSVSINAAINDMEHALNLIDVTLEDIANLKDKYQKEFAKYEYSFFDYSDTIKKLNKMENAILNNKVKMQLMQKELFMKEKENQEKMERVKKLNSME